MNDERTFLAFIHKTAAMGVGTLPQAMGLPQSRAMVPALQEPALQEQLRECRTIAARAQAYARAQGEALRGPGSAALALAGAALRTRAVLDPSTSTLAERLIRESTGGAVETARRLHQCTRDTDPALVELGRRLLAAQERTIQEMKRFL